ncbi:hypothetical protein [Photorhabdus khanii]|uniref:hypothetical protein n=1 Tax=Photorhabdus khanii TaxID=1004150 RepID=UPI001EEF82A9|nr:hypothetical protein [Photorhabdus khanii]
MGRAGRGFAGGTGRRRHRGVNGGDRGAGVSSSRRCRRGTRRGLCWRADERRGGGTRTIRCQ